MHVDECEHLSHKIIAVLGMQYRSAIQVQVHHLDNCSACCQLGHHHDVVLHGIGHWHCDFTVQFIGICIDNQFGLGLGLVAAGKHGCLSSSGGQFRSLHQCRCCIG